jgi:hypothetical protein
MSLFVENQHACDGVGQPKTFSRLGNLTFPGRGRSNLATVRNGSDVPDDEPALLYAKATSRKQSESTTTSLTYPCIDQSRASSLVSSTIEIDDQSILTTVKEFLSSINEDLRSSASLESVTVAWPSKSRRRHIGTTQSNSDWNSHLVVPSSPSKTWKCYLCKLDKIKHPCCDI